MVCSVSPGHVSINPVCQGRQTAITLPRVLNLLQDGLYHVATGMASRPICEPHLDRRSKEPFGLYNSMLNRNNADNALRVTTILTGEGEEREGVGSES